jgi:hypothetical protein
VPWNRSATVSTPERRHDSRDLSARSQPPSLLLCCLCLPLPFFPCCFACCVVGWESALRRRRKAGNGGHKLPSAGGGSIGSTGGPCADGHGDTSRRHVRNAPFHLLPRSAALDSPVRSPANSSEVKQPTRTRNDGHELLRERDGPRNWGRAAEPTQEGPEDDGGCVTLCENEFPRATLDAAVQQGLFENRA